MIDTFENIDSVGDFVSLFFMKLYRETTTNFNVPKSELYDKWITELLFKKFGIEKLSTRGFKFVDGDVSAGIFGSEMRKKYGKKKTFNVEELRIFLNNKYK